MAFGDLNAGTTHRASQLQAAQITRSSLFRLPCRKLGGMRRKVALFDSFLSSTFLYSSETWMHDRGNLNRMDTEQHDALVTAGIFNKKQNVSGPIIHDLHLRNKQINMTKAKHGTENWSFSAMLRKANLALRIAKQGDESLTKRILCWGPFLRKYCESAPALQAVGLEQDTAQIYVFPDGRAALRQHALRLFGTHWIDSIDQLIFRYDKSVFGISESHNACGLKAGEVSGITTRRTFDWLAANESTYSSLLSDCFRKYRSENNTNDIVNVEASTMGLPPPCGHAVTFHKVTKFSTFFEDKGARGDPMGFTFTAPPSRKLRRFTTFLPSKNILD